MTVADFNFNTPVETCISYFDELHRECFTPKSPATTKSRYYRELDSLYVVNPFTALRIAHDQNKKTGLVPMGQREDTFFRAILAKHGNAQAYAIMIDLYGKDQYLPSHIERSFVELSIAHTTDLVGQGKLQTAKDVLDFADRTIGALQDGRNGTAAWEQEQIADIYPRITEAAIRNGDVAMQLEMQSLSTDIPKNLEAVMQGLDDLIDRDPLRALTVYENAYAGIAKKDVAESVRYAELFLNAPIPISMDKRMGLLDWHHSTRVDKPKPYSRTPGLDSEQYVHHAMNLLDQTTDEEERVKILGHAVNCLKDLDEKSPARARCIESIETAIQDISRNFYLVRNYMLMFPTYVTRLDDNDILTIMARDDDISETALRSLGADDRNRILTLCETRFSEAPQGCLNLLTSLMYRATPESPEWLRLAAAFTRICKESPESLVGTYDKYNYYQCFLGQVESFSRDYQAPDEHAPLPRETTQAIEKILHENLDFDRLGDIPSKTCIDWLFAVNDAFRGSSPFSRKTLNWFMDRVPAIVTENAKENFHVLPRILFDRNKIPNKTKAKILDTYEQNPELIANEADICADNGHYGTTFVRIIREALTARNPKATWDDFERFLPLYREHAPVAALAGLGIASELLSDEVRTSNRLPELGDLAAKQAFVHQSFLELFEKLYEEFPEQAVRLLTNRNLTDNLKTEIFNRMTNPDRMRELREIDPLSLMAAVGTLRYSSDRSVKSKANEIYTEALSDAERLYGIKFPEGDPAQQFVYGLR